MTLRILALGDAAVTVEFAPGYDAAARRSVVHLDAAIAGERAEGRLAGVIDTAPTFRSLTVHFDPLALARADLEAAVAALVAAADDATAIATRHWRFPVTYGGAGGPDLERLAAAGGMTQAQAIDLHAGTEVKVAMIGFLPGFAFMGDIAPALRQPRLSEPRLRVPAGAVAVADRLTAIYPWESPGGWHLIGTCPVPFFDARRDPPALLSPADRVAFEPVAPDRVAALSASLATGNLDPDSFRVDP